MKGAERPRAERRAAEREARKGTRRGVASNGRGWITWLIAVVAIGAAARPTS